LVYYHFFRNGGYYEITIRSSSNIQYFVSLKIEPTFNKKTRGK